MKIKFNYGFWGLLIIILDFNILWGYDILPDLVGVGLLGAYFYTIPRNRENIKKLIFLIVIFLLMGGVMFFTPTYINAHLGVEQVITSTIRKLVFTSIILCVLYNICQSVVIVGEEKKCEYIVDKGRIIGNVVLVFHLIYMLYICFAMNFRVENFWVPIGLFQLVQFFLVVFLLKDTDSAIKELERKGN